MGRFCGLYEFIEMLTIIIRTQLYIIFGQEDFLIICICHLIFKCFSSNSRYEENRRVLRDGMKKLGFKEFLDDSHEGYIITSYYNPKHANYDFTEFYQQLSAKDQVIYPGKVSDADCFRIGNIGRLYPKDMEHLLECIEEVLKNMNVQVPLED